ncbi:serine/threonine protein kinase, partial [Frankia sp. CNm7]
MLTPLSPGDRRALGQYRLKGRLGTGGMGTVFLGVSPEGRPVAVKVIRADLLDEPEFRERFRREVTAAARVRGDHVARVLDADLDAEQPWMATEYVEGTNLMTAVTRHGRLDGTSLATLAAGLAEGLVAVHAAGVVHRDLKPANILLTWEGPKIIDFGLARADDLTGNTSGGNLIGTVAWMAPEQLNGDPATPATDVFNWGLCVAFAARGRHPFEAQTAAATAMRILSTEPALDGVPPQTRALVAAALDRDPAARPSA